MAKHAKTEDGIIAEFDTSNLHPTPETIARTAAFVVAWLNQLFAFIGAPVLDVDESTVYIVISSLVTFVISLWAWWKNNSFTKAAIAADEMKDAIKAVGEDE